MYVAYISILIHIFINIDLRLCLSCTFTNIQREDQVTWSMKKWQKKERGRKRRNMRKRMKTRKRWNDRKGGIRQKGKHWNRRIKRKKRKRRIVGKQNRLYSFSCLLLYSFVHLFTSFLLSPFFIHICFSHFFLIMFLAFSNFPSI